MKQKNSLELKWRLCWFGRNLSAFILSLIALPFGWLLDIVKCIIVLFITDGSQTISFPWHWDWSLK